MNTRPQLASTSLLIALVGAGCPKSPPPAAESPAPVAASQPASRPASGPAASAVAARASESKTRLEQTEAGRIVLVSTEAHGGIDAWFRGGALQFRYDYRPVGERPPINTLQTIDLLTSRAYHQVAEPAKGDFAFDGEVAWMKLETEAPFNPRFWALTPYYFVGVPFVLGDPGVKLTLVDDDPAAAGLPPCDVVMATFAAGTGDAPDDYYVLYFAKDSSRLLGLRYVVSYPAFFAGKDTKHTPEKLVVYDRFEAAGPLTLSRLHTFFDFSGGKRGDKVTDATVSEVRYGAPFDAARLKAPEGAKIDPPAQR